MVGPLAHGRGFLRADNAGNRDDFVQHWEIEKVDFMKIKPMYEAFWKDFVDHGWYDPEIKGQKSGNWESLYYERSLANKMKEHRIWWRLVRDTNSNSKYLRWAMKIDFQTLAVSDAEIAYKGKKKKIESADLTIRVWMWLQWDPYDLFKNSIVGNFENFFRRKIFKAELEQEWFEVINESTKIKNMMKNYLEMEEPGEQQIPFSMRQGYKDHIDPLEK